MKTIEETFKAEKEILEEFFKNRKITKIREDGLTLSEEEYKIFSYGGKTKNLQELNVKNSFDLLEYLKPCFVYIASYIETIKEEIKKEHADSLTMYQNYYFYITIYLPIIDTYYIGHEDKNYKKEIFFKNSLNGNELINYIKREIEEVGIAFMFTTNTILFYIDVKIYRSYEYMFGFMMNGPHVAHHNLNLNSKPDKKIINAEKTFKEDKCVICLTNPPNILFCNCGHQVLCIECSKTGESLENCPICKTKNTNLRIIQ